jgi:hypothetical protein
MPRKKAEVQNLYESTTWKVPAEGLRPAHQQVCLMRRSTIFVHKY